MQRDAVISACGRYRYRLTRAWGPGGGVAWIMLNPSIADASRDDPTLKECVRRSLSWGAGWLIVVNLFGLISSDPRLLLTDPDPVGPENDAYVIQAIDSAQLVICAWGNGGRLADRADRVCALLDAHWTSQQRAGRYFPRLGCLGRTGFNAPKHPLARGAHRIPRDMIPQEFPLSYIYPSG